MSSEDYPTTSNSDPFRRAARLRERQVVRAAIDANIDLTQVMNTGAWPAPEPLDRVYGSGIGLTELAIDQENQLERTIAGE